MGLGLAHCLPVFFLRAFSSFRNLMCLAQNLVFGVQSTPISTIVLMPTIHSTATATATATTTITATITENPKFTSTPTQLPSPTATLTGAQIMVFNGEIAFSGPLSREQQIRLYEASLFFVAPTYKESKKMSELINNARFSDPNTTCGPLSMGYAGFEV